MPGRAKGGPREGQGRGAARKMGGWDKSAFRRRGFLSFQPFFSSALSFSLRLLPPPFRSVCTSVNMADPVLFDSQFTVNAVDPDGKKFERGEWSSRCGRKVGDEGDGLELIGPPSPFSLPCEKVSRIVGHSSSLDMNISLDVAVDIYPVSVAQNLTLQIASSLGKSTGDGEGGDNDRDAWRLEGGGGLADEFDYVMYGKVSAGSVVDGIHTRPSDRHRHTHTPRCHCRSTSTTTRRQRQ